MTEPVLSGTAPTAHMAGTLSNFAAHVKRNPRLGGRRAASYRTISPASEFAPDAVMRTGASVPGATPASRTWTACR